MSLANLKEPAEAISAFDQAQKMGDKSPDLLISLAVLHRAGGNTTKFEQILWKLMSDQPGLAESYLTLFQYYSGAGNANKCLAFCRAGCSPIRRRRRRGCCGSMC